jgi:hypothetical protein
MPVSDRAIAGAGAFAWRRFLAQACAFVGLVVLFVWGLGEIILSCVSWTVFQDPRRRLLWDEDLSRYRIFLLGDSVFCSSYVDRPEETLWARLSGLVGEEVFPGALIGATQNQIVEEARVIARARAGKGGVVFVDVVPSKFLITRATDGDRSGFSKALARRYAGRLRLPCTLGEVENWLQYSLTRPFFLLRNPEATDVIVEALVHKQVYFGTTKHHNAVWTEGDSLERKRFGRNLQTLAARPRAPTLGWVLDASTVLRKAGLRPIVVICPLNRAYLDDSVGVSEGMALYERISEARHAEIGEMRSRGIDAIDLLDEIPGEGFADLGHTNTLGDELVARALHCWLRGSVPASRVEAER